MADPTHGSNPREGSRIDLGDENALGFWTRELGVDERLLREAVESVGSLAAEVRTYITGVPPMQ